MPVSGSGLCADSRPAASSLFAFAAAYGEDEQISGSTIQSSIVLAVISASNVLREDARSRRGVSWREPVRAHDIETAVDVVGEHATITGSVHGAPGETRAGLIGRRHCKGLRVVA